MNKFPSVTVDQMREVDRMMVEEIGVSILMMMENASRNIAVMARKMLGGSVKDKKIVILCGKGNNGGDGLGAARHLTNFGANVTCFLATSARELGPNAKLQQSIALHSNILLHETSPHHKLAHAMQQADLVIDALLGYNLKGNPKEPFASMITVANDSKKPILAVDIPSGLDGDTGKPHSPTIKAAVTLTLALPKAGLLKASAKEYVEELYVADLSVPSVVYDKLGLKVPPLFEHEEVIKLL